MTPLKTSVAGAAALVVTMQSVVAGPNSVPIQVICDTAETVDVCEALGVALNENGYAVDILREALPDDAAGLVLRFDVTRQTDHVLAGRLLWSDPRGETGSGPELELTAMDSAIRSGMLRSYVDHLLNLSAVPL